MPLIRRPVHYSDVCLLGALTIHVTFLASQIKCLQVGSGPVGQTMPFFPSLKHREQWSRPECLLPDAASSARSLGSPLSMMSLSLGVVAPGGGLMSGVVAGVRLGAGWSGDRLGNSPDFGFSET